MEHPTGDAPSRAGEIEIPPNKLLEATHGERMDTGTAGAAGSANQTLEAVGEINRAQVRKRKGEGGKKRR